MVELDRQFGDISLTDRERDILRLLTNGLTDSEIAEAFVLTVGTVKWYNRQIYSKLGVRSRTQASAEAQRLGLLERASGAQPPPPPKHNLPAQVTSFTGRSRELAELKRLLQESRLVTLTGPPGTGKTRLALEVAGARLDQYPDGVYFVSLAPVSETGLVVNTIAQTLEIKGAGGSILAAVQATLRDKRLLLVLDNFEHLLGAASLVSELLGNAPHLTVLVTSREMLHLYGEAEFSVPPLQLPDLKTQTSTESLASCEAVQLFVQRASTAQPKFAITEANAASVATICVHLDGLPLAIELAAARVKFYAPQTLLMRLSSRLEALSEGPRDLPARQRTLRATLAWSYDLLDTDEKILFARLGVFAGGCSLDDTIAVCSGGLNLEVAAGLESLANKSLLLQTRDLHGEPRFTMLETMREYALEKLSEAGETALVRERHARHFQSLAEAGKWELYRPETPYWMARLEADHDNLRAALEWILQTNPDGETGLRLVANLARFWEVGNYLYEARGWLHRALESRGADAPSAARADALRLIADIAYLQSDYAATRTFYEEALAIYRELGDEGNAAHSLLGIGEVDTEVGDFDSALALFEQAYTIMRQRDDVFGRARAVAQLGFAATRLGQYEQARKKLEEALVLYRQVDEKIGTTLVYSGLGEIAVREGRFDEATALLSESLRLREEVGYKWGIAASLGSLAWVALLQGDFAQAMKTLAESLLIRKEIGDVGGMAWCLEKFAEIAHLRGDSGRATRIYGAAAALRAPVNSVIDPTDQPAYEQVIDRLRRTLSDDVYQSVWTEGTAMPLDRVIEYALSEL